MKAFKYTAPTSESGACKLLGENALAYAGGTNLLNLMKDHVIEPDVLVDLKSIAALSEIKKAGDGVQIGAGVTIAEILENEALAADYPVLHQALHDLGTPQIRHRGTLGGNLCARPACWYFTHEGFDCAKHGGTGCAAKTGENEFHAIFDTDGPCVMVHPSSGGQALLALGARVGVAGPDTTREFPLEDFFVSPGRDVRRENVLAANEIVTHVTLGAPARNSATYDVRQKASHDWPICSASVVLQMSFGVCKSARVVLGAVAPVPRRARGAEAALSGQRIDARTAEAAAEAALDGAKPLAQGAYKVSVTRAAVKRAILVAGTGKWS